MAFEAVISKSLPQDPKFLKNCVYCVYVVLYMLLHYLLLALVEISLCISTLYNHSIYVWMSFIVLILVVFKKSMLQTCAFYIQILFNASFTAQYFMWLGLTDGKIKITHVSSQWAEFLGVYNVSHTPLISLCITSMIFTLYMEFRSVFVDYNDARV